MSAERTFSAGFLFCGLGAGARGSSTRAPVSKARARFREPGRDRQAIRWPAGLSEAQRRRRLCADLAKLTPPLLRDAWGDGHRRRVPLASLQRLLRSAVQEERRERRSTSAENRLVCRGCPDLRDMARPPTLIVLENVRASAPVVAPAPGEGAPVGLPGTDTSSTRRPTLWARSEAWRIADLVGRTARGRASSARAARCRAEVRCCARPPISPQSWVASWKRIRTRQATGAPSQERRTTGADARTFSSTMRVRRPRHVSQIRNIPLQDQPVQRLVTSLLRRSSWTADRRSLCREARGTRASGASSPRHRAGARRQLGEIGTERGAAAELLESSQASDRCRSRQVPESRLVLSETGARVDEPATPAPRPQNRIQPRMYVSALIVFPALVDVWRE